MKLLLSLSILKLAFEVGGHEDDGVEGPGDGEDNQRLDLKVHPHAGVGLRELADPLSMEELSGAQGQRQEADAD